MSKEKGEKKSNNIVKVFFTLFFMILLIIVVFNSTTILRNSKDIYVVANGSLLYEEQAEGYIIRDELILQGENYKNGMVQILSDGERSAKGEAVFRYYSNSEENILKQIKDYEMELLLYLL